MSRQVRRGHPGRAELGVMDGSNAENSIVILGP